jgi:murein DD-endopeptidase MepM/ murein hydrolase activator NlpD
MKKLSHILTVLLLVLIGAQLGVGNFVYAADVDQLKNAIDQKAKELEAVNKQLEATQDVLEDVQVRGKTLNQEIKRIDTSLSQVDLSIKASEIKISKTSLEIQSLNNSIAEKEAAIALRRDAVGRLLQRFQERDGESLLSVFLKNVSLSQNLAETETIDTLNDSLLDDVSVIRQLKDDLNQRLQDVSDKKKSIEAENQNLKVKKSIAVEQKADKQSLLSQTKNQEKAYQQVVSELEKKQAEISSEIDTIEQQLRANFDSSMLPLKRPGVFANPVAKGVITQLYGATAFAQKAYRSKFHNGIDFGVSVGTPIYAAEEGKVLMAGNNGKVQYGKYVLIKHTNNLVTLYAHLSRQMVSTGDTVTRGQLIGYSGNTGYSFGAHLHFTAYYEPPSCDIARTNRKDCVQLQSIPGAGLVPVGITVDPGQYL